MSELVPDLDQSIRPGMNSLEASPAKSRSESAFPSFDDAGLPYIVEPMRLDHLDQVMAIENITFSAPWSARSYRYEITQNDYGTLIIVRPRRESARQLPKWLSWLSCSKRSPVLGYAGFWLLVDEAHIATIAVHPEWRGQGLGELLLSALLEEGANQGARQATLEVRRYNKVAQALYHKYGFEIIGLRKCYYTDNKEDALIMTTPAFDTPDFRSNLHQCRRRLYEHLRKQGFSKQA